MHIFDEIRVQNLDRRQLQLTLLASMTIAVLATGLALLMYPAIFSQDIIVSSQTLRFAYYGFCCLSVLFLGYLWDRQLTMRKLKQQLDIQQRRDTELRIRASNDLLHTIPGKSTFRERMFAHCVQVGAKAPPFSIVVARVYLSGSLSHKSDEVLAFGDVAQVIQRRLRAEDSVYILSSGVYGIILPATDTAAARQFTSGLELGLQDAAGVNSRFTSDIKSFNHPQQCASALDLERAVASLVQ